MQKRLLGANVCQQLVSVVECPWNAFCTPPTNAIGSWDFAAKKSRELQQHKPKKLQASSHWSSLHTTCKQDAATAATVVSTETSLNNDYGRERCAGKIRQHRNIFTSTYIQKYAKHFSHPLTSACPRPLASHSAPAKCNIKWCRDSEGVDLHITKLTIGSQWSSRVLRSWTLANKQYGPFGLRFWSPRLEPWTDSNQLDGELYAKSAVKVCWIPKLHEEMKRKYT